MKIKRMRTYRLDPHYRSEVHQAYGAFRTYKSLRSGNEYDILVGAGRTPKQAQLTARKRRKTKDKREPITRQELGMDRRVAKHYLKMITSTPGQFRRLRERLDNKRAEQHVQPE